MSRLSSQSTKKNAKPGSATAYWQTERSTDAHVDWKGRTWIRIETRPPNIWATGQTTRNSGGDVTIFRDDGQRVFAKEQSGTASDYRESWWELV